MAFDSSAYVYREGTSPNTTIAVSQKVKIYAVPYGDDVNKQIGVSSEFSQDAESRDMQVVRGIGYGDKVLEIVPGVTSEASIQITRRLMYVTNMHQVLGYRGGAAGLVRSLRHHRWPFDLKQELVFSEHTHIEASTRHTPGGVHLVDDGVNRRSAIVTWFQGCWVESYGVTGITADGSILDEAVTAKVTDVVSELGYVSRTDERLANSGNSPFLPGQKGSSLFGEPFRG